MKSFSIIETFNGCQEGHLPVETFTQGEVVELSESLAEVAVNEGWAEETEAPISEADAAEKAAADAAEKAAKKGK
jgi:hypothetical protein